MSEAYPDVAFSMLYCRIWLGENPVDHLLKKAMDG